MADCFLIVQPPFSSASISCKGMEDNRVSEYQMRLNDDQPEFSGRKP